MSPASHNKAAGKKKRAVPMRRPVWVWMWMWMRNSVTDSSQARCFQREYSHSHHRVGRGPPVFYLFDFEAKWCQCSGTCNNDDIVPSASQSIIFFLGEVNNARSLSSASIGNRGTATPKSSHAGSARRQSHILVFHHLSQRHSSLPIPALETTTAPFLASSVQTCALVASHASLLARFSLMRLRDEPPCDQTGSSVAWD